MNKEKQRIAIAEACGWRRDKRGLGWLDSNGEYGEIPDYLNDLNAMHEAIWDKRADRDFVQEYCKQIRKVVGGAEWATFALENASAAHRAEAFLRAIGKWEDGE